MASTENLIACPECGGRASRYFDAKTGYWNESCRECSYYNSSIKQDAKEIRGQAIDFTIRLKAEDFAIGDSFWIGETEIEIVGMKNGVLMIYAT